MPDTLLPHAKWRLIEPLLADNRRDRAVVTAVLFRQTTAVGLRDVAELFGLTRSRLSDWERDLQADGSLEKILRELKLRRAGDLMWRAGGTPHWRRRGDGGEMAQHLLDRFAEQLGRSPRRKASQR